MKTIRNITIVSFVLFILISGSSFGASAINNTSDRTNQTVVPATHLSGEDFSVDIGFVGYGSTEGQRITPETGTNIYHYIDADAAAGFNLVRLKTNITGYTCWGTCTDTSLTGDRSVWDATVGAAYIIVDGNVLPAGNGYMSSSGSDVAIAGVGDHTVTFLYIGKDQNDGHVYGYDTIILRIATDEANLGTYETSTVSISSTVDEVGVAGTTYNDTAVAYYDPSWSSWTKEDYNEPVADVSFERNGYPVSANVVYDLDGSTITIGGEMNSAGFDGLQIERVQTTTLGMAFFIDASGLQPLDEADTLTFYNNALSDTSVCTPTLSKITYAGVVVFADNGRWVEDAVEYPSWQSPFEDYEGFGTVTDAANSSITYDTNASMDFTYKVDAPAHFFSNDVPDSTCIQDTETFFTTTTDTITSQETTTSTSTKTESPGFGVIVSLISIGVIAFVAPRLRREKK
jgi:hypothetical protein